VSRRERSISAGTSGFGEAYAQAALGNGDQVALTARHPERLRDPGCGNSERTAMFALDVTDADQVRSVVSAAEGRFGRIDVLVNNAGGGSAGSVEETGEAEIRSTFEANFFGAVALIRAVLPGMRARRSGTIINMSSVGGIRAFPGVGYYNAAKFAIEGISESLRREVGPLGIKVLVVEPGSFRTHAGSAAYRTAGMPPIAADYQATVGVLRADLARASGRQPGDPRRAAQAIVQAIESGSPPYRLVLGNLGYQQVVSKLQDMLDETRAWEQVSRSADFPDTDHVPGEYL
jgi:NAD(P)-dependent dehydrogenase (short-subunit alcohol dehydrogenase family)